MTRRCVFPALCLVLLGVIPTAEAIIIRDELTPDLDEIDAPVFPETETRIYVPYEITAYGGGNSRDYRVTKVGRKKLTVHVAKGALPSNINIDMTGEHHVSIRFYIATSQKKAASRIELYEPGTMPIASPGVSVPPIGEIVVHTSRVDTPRQIPWSVAGHQLVLRVGFTLHAGSSVMPIELSSEFPYPVHGLQLRDHLNRPVDAEIIFGTDPGREPTELRPGVRLKSAFYIKDPHQIANGWTLVATSSAGVAPAQFTWGPEREKGPLEEKLAVAVHVLGGTSKLDDGVGNDENAWTVLHGIGGRALYGVSRHLSIEAAVDFTRTSEAVFADATWDQVQGELRAKETAGRVLAGGRLHTAGKRWIPYGRAAVGARFSRHALSMASRTESEIRSGALFGFGGGLNVLLGRSVLAGLALDYTVPIGGDDTAQGVELGLSLAATWDL